MARCRYHPNGVEQLSSEELCYPSEILQVELFRLALAAAFPNEGGFWTPCLEGAWRDLERWVGEGKAIDIMAECLERTRKHDVEQRGRNPRGRFLHGLLMECVEDAESQAQGQEANPFEIKF